MTEISMRMARDQNDIADARALCTEWLNWHWANYPVDWPRGPDHPMDRSRFLAVLEQLGELHARPLGGILIASLKARPAGCVMYRQAAPGVAEFNRLFVSETCRGNSIGRLLLDTMFQQMIADGYEKVFFSSATFLTHARAMYGKVGFADMPHPEGFSDAWRDKVYFMERSLA
jgi:GNAT superfamily N-acetyltransferase